MKSAPPLTTPAAEALAIQAFTYIAEDPAKLGRFLNETGIGPDEIRKAAGEPGFLAGVLDHIAADERMLMAFSAEAGIDPVQIVKALQALGGGTFDSEVP